MLQLFNKDNLVRVWDDRFRYGVDLSALHCGLHRFNNGHYIISIHLGILTSPGTGHWPWQIFEIAMATGPGSGWHIGLLGFTVGKCTVHNVDNETQEIVGPDRAKYYSFFKGINHRQQQLEEFI